MKKSLVILTLFSAMGLVSFAQTKVIAHRGAWKNTKMPQNSLASLNEAAKLHVWGSEFDVHVTKDDILVVNHDDDFYGLDIATSTYEELLAKKHPNGESIPTAEAYLKEGMKHKHMKLIFELKTNKLGTERTLKSAELSVALVKKLKAQKWVEYIAFSYDACLKLRELDKSAMVHYLSGDKTPQEIKDATLSGIDYHLSVYQKKPTWISEANGLKLKTNVWTVNKEDDMKYFIDHKIDYISTDEPEKLNGLLGK
ncbi:glycerophosphodiester phosphodiesterase [Sphingobacterium griseoflavum]|uniref:Glycerophosphoryl diester phosphodiesterase n=1 Tax=Sphingobacterium griseoflavum TaxID=1474952 RepID=A0ABQ3HZY0_9SPHI|nr:glycerophosphodiester phosphodiesterase family protein [Sphingobacterium griseoflavum]GHE40932.1 glycerophosphoryl diester phosphodiesterase [Sphingobacterium griseoflavum]